MSKSVLVFFILLISNQGKAQNFEWLRSFGMKTGGFIISNVFAETGGKSSFFITSYGSGPNQDTFQFDAFKVIRKPNTGLNCVVFLDSLSKVIGVKELGTFYGKNMCKDDSGNYYVTGILSGINAVDTAVLSNKKGRVLFAKFDKKLKLKWATQGGNDTSNYQSSIVFSDNHLYFLSASRGDSVKFGNKTYNPGKSLFFYFGELDKSTGKVIWSKHYKGRDTSYSTLWIGNILRLNGSLYISGEVDEFSGMKGVSLSVRKDSIYGSGGFIFRTDTLGNFNSSFNLYGGHGLSINTDGQFIYIGGFYRDSFYWNNQIINNKFFNKKRTRLALLTASIDTGLKPRWFYTSKILDTTSKYATCLATNIICHKGYVYFGGEVQQMKVLIDSNIIDALGSYDMLILKTDFLGNVLWSATGGTNGTSQSFTNIRNMNAMEGESVVVGGMFSGNLTFGSFKISSKSLNDNWITKLTDYSITRGPVKMGPYCAGDSIRIPYTKFGKFDSTNTFIAQLSDEDGNFENGYRELGRVKTNKDGTIIGVLPLFKVSSSANYRIRILSTKPAVQSYYRRDSLRLLIYSKDKADPGSTESICYGDSIRLNTYGGTKWLWSPNVNMEDSNLRNPKVWPKSDITYKIIIADSSGCGKPDTAFKKIIVHPPLKAILAFKDTTLCDSGALTIPVQFKGGDTIGYRFQWFYVSTAKWFPMQKGQHRLSDTLFYTAADPNEKLALILTDDCSNKIDTVYLTIRKRSTVNIKTQLNDTVVCNGRQINYNATAIGGIPSGYKWKWMDIGNNYLLSNVDTLIHIAKQTIKVELSVNDGCPALGDSKVFIIYVNPPLKGAILFNKGSLNDTTLCYGKSLKLFSTGKGGTGSGYNYKWYLDKTLLSSADTLNFSTSNFYTSSGGTKTLSLILKDNCTNGSDSVSRLIKVIPGPLSDFSWGNACNKTKIPFVFTGSLAVSPVSTKYTWQFPDGDSSNNQNPSKLLNQIGKNKVTLVLRSSNGCNDAITKDVDVKQEAIAGFTAIDVCEDSAVNFINTSKDGIDYEWKFGDGKSSTLETPKHQYLISGVTQTFNVSLIAKVPNGCADTITNSVTINANPKSDFSFTTSDKQVSFTAIEKSATNYNWTFGDGGTSNTTNPKTTYNYSKFPSGKYTACLKVSNIAGCVSETCKVVNITGLTTQLIKENGFKIYPNPSQGSFTVEVLNQKGPIVIEVYNSTGQLVYNKTSQQPIVKLDLMVPNGVYLIRVNNGEQVFNKNILINK
jgi:hypothetical protein